MSKIVFNLSAITVAAAADAAGIVATEALHVECMGWHGAGLYPNVSDVAKALRVGYAAHPMVSVSDDTLKQYASGIIKWAKAGIMPKRPGLKPFMGSVPGAKSTRGRKPKATAPAADKAQADAPNLPDNIGAYLQSLRQMLAKLNTVGMTAQDVEKVREPLTLAVAYMVAAKGEMDKAAK